MRYLKMRLSCTMDTNEPCAVLSSSGSALPQGRKIGRHGDDIGIVKALGNA